uniref:SusC/RagA family TonB-linked outer membrane protein n=1 Tax=Roseihalotalea indica TaxID=2867963 RepID=A0AA49JIX3_9BACT|nr:SusC/RagA family TonB-linked outer membrane protein [Tunicatimonas sp. TK19036]
MANDVRNYGRRRFFFPFCLLFLVTMGFLGQLQAQSLASNRLPFTYEERQIEKVSLKQLLGELESLHDVKFAFDERLVQDKLVNASQLNRQELDQTLSEVLQPLKLQYKQLTQKYYVIKRAEEKNGEEFQKVQKRGVGAIPTATRQTYAHLPSLPADYLAVEKTISGTVNDQETNEPLPGVNVLAKGTNTGTVTDVNGSYRLTVSDDVTTLIFSSIGYLSEEVEIGDRAEVNIILTPDIQSLQEIVVIGYGTQEKKDLTGAIASVDGEAIAERGTVSPLQAVQGQIAGVDISAGSGRAGAGYNIQIRGQNSLSGGNPLFVVDGVIVDNIDFLNPQDIKSIDILKDASSTAVFGSRGSNGVVIVTTKQGTAGEARISYDGYVGVRQNARQPDFMSGDEWWEYRQNTYISPALISGDSYDATVGGLDGSDVLAERLANKDYTFWPDYFLQTGLQQNHWLTVSGGGEKANYLLGAGYQQEKGNLLKDQFKRYNFKASINSQLNTKWSAGASFNFSLSETERGSPRAIINAYRMSPLVSPYDSLGEPLYQPAKYAGISFTSSVSPLFENWYSEDNTRAIFGVGNLYLQYSPVDWIDIRSTFAPRINYQRRGRYWGSQTETRNLADPAARREDSESFSYNWDNQITAHRQYGDHNITLMGLYSLWYERNESSDIYVENLPYESLYYNLGTAPDILSVGSGFSKISLLSYMGRLNYSFRDKYLFTAAARWDGSSKLAPGYKWAAFPSVAVGWRISEESFLQNASFVDNLKLRLSYGFTGNNNIDPYSTQVLANNQTFYDFGGSIAKGFAPSGIVNPRLSWERTREVNFGIDYDFFQGRISGTIDLYDKLSSNLLLERDLPRETGWGPITDNIGSVSNKGIELSLRTVNISTNDFTWSTTFTFARNKNAIEELLNGKEDLVGNRWFIGEPIQVNYTYVFDGIWQLDEADEAAQYNQLPGQARVKDLNDDDAITDDDYAIIGTPMPDWTGGFSTQVRYRGFDFSTSLFARQGVQVESPFHDEFLNYRDRGRAKLMSNYFMPPNDVTPTRVSNEYPQPNNVGNYWNSVKAYRDASFVKVQNIQLGYRLPYSLIERVGIQNLRVYANVLNPFVFTKYDGFDPEWADEGLESSGNSFINYQFGVNVTF